MNLNIPSVKSGSLTLIDMDAARRARLESLALSWPPRRAMPAGCDQQGRYLTRGHGIEQWPDTMATDFGDDQPQPAEAASELGADTRPAALSMRRHRTAGRVALALIAAPTVAAVVAVGGFIVQHLP